MPRYLVKKDRKKIPAPAALLAVCRNGVKKISTIFKGSRLAVLLSPYYRRACDTFHILKKSRKGQAIFMLLATFFITGGIFVLAELGGYGVNGPATAPNSLDYGLVGYWDMEEGSGQTIKDKSGNGNDGTLGANNSVGTDDPAFVSGHNSSGPNGTGLKFDGINDYARILHSDSLSPTAAITVQAWINPDGAQPDHARIVDKAYNISYSLNVTSANKLEFQAHLGGVAQTFLSTGTFTPNVFNNVAVTYNGSNVAFFINGVPAGTFVPTTNGAIGTGTNNFSIGINTGNGNVFRGSLDEIRVYNRAISEDEIRLLYNQKKPILHLKMDEGSGTTLYDESFNNRDGKIYNKINTAISSTADTLTDNDVNWGTNYWAGQQVSILSGTGAGQTRTISSNINVTLTVSQNWTIAPDNTSRYAITMLGSNWTDRNGSPAVYLNDVGHIGYAPNINPVTGNSDFTMAAWVKTNSATAQTIMAQRTPAGVNGEYVFSITSSGNIDYWDYNSVYGIQATSNKTVSDNNWHHVEFTRQGNTGYIYIDGALDKSVSGTAVTMDPTFIFAIGVDYRDAVNYFNGSLDDIRVYNYARTADEVLADLNDGTAAHFGANNQDLNRGLIGYWDFEEGGGQIVKDKSGNGNHGTLGSSSSADSADPVFTPGFNSAGSGGTGLKFDGVDDYVKVDNSTSLNPTSAITVQAFVYANSTSNYQNIIKRGWNSSGAWTLESGGGKWSFGIKNQSGSYYNAQSACNIAVGKWQQVTGVWDGSQVRIYVNGVLEGSTATTGSIGINADLYMAYSSIFNGNIDEVRIYNRALSEDEIRQLYNKKKPILEYRFDEGTGSTLNDESFNDNDATLVNSPLYVGGKSASAIDLESTSSQYGYLGDNASISLTKDLTISSWIKPESVTASTQFDIAGKWDGANESYLLCQYGDEIRMYIDSASNYKTTNSANLAVGTWYHVEAIYKASTANVDIYVNGILQAGTVTGTIPISIGDDAGRFQVGAEDSTTTAANFYDGIIDSLRIYSYARSVEEVLTDYNEGNAAHFGKNNQALSDGLVGYWDMEEGGGQTVYDKSGSGNDGTLGASSAAGTDDPVFVAGHDSTGENGTAMSFDGTDDYVDCGNDSSLNMTSAVTVSVWMKLPVLPSQMPEDYPGFIRKGYKFIFWFAKGSNRAVFKWRDSTGTYHDSSPITNTVFEANKWYHVVFTYDGSYARAYINGSLDNSTAFSGSLYSNPTESLSLGKADQNFTGILDEVRIYNRALSEDEIRMLYNQKKPILEMKFDEGSGVKAYDESFNNNDGTLGGDGVGTDLPTWVQGESGTALQFDGTDDYINAGKDSSLNTSGGFTYAAWVKFDSLDYVNNAGTVYGLSGKGNPDQVEPSAGWWVTYDNRNNKSSFQYVCFGNSAGGWVGGGNNFNGYNYVFTPGVFYRIAVTVDSSSKAKLYINGQQLGADKTLSNLVLSNPSSDLLIGTNGVAKLDGALDNVRIYNYALSAAEILTDYNSGLAARLR